jgi:nucleotide-binding universal stress UspA family protein
LFPTDFSESTQAALDYASRLASETGATLYIVHADEMEKIAAVMVDSGYPYPPPWDDAGRRESHRKLDAIVPTVPGVRCEHAYLTGAPSGEIVLFAEQEGIDLIVMASHGRSGLTRLLLGSTAEGVMRRAPCPVLIVKQPVPEGTSGEPLVAANRQKLQT